MRRRGRAPGGGIGGGGGGGGGGADSKPPNANHRATVWIKAEDEKMVKGAARSAGNSPQLKSRSRRVVDL